MFKPENDRCDTFYLLFFYYIMHRISPLPQVFFENWNIQIYLLHTFCFLYSIILAFPLSPLLSSLWTGLWTIFPQSIILCIRSILKQIMTNFDVQYHSLYFIQVFNFYLILSKHIGFLEQYMRGLSISRIKVEFFNIEKSGISWRGKVNILFFMFMVQLK